MVAWLFIRIRSVASNLREALNKVVLMTDLAALVLSMLLCGSHLVSGGIRLARNLMKQDD